MVNNKMMEEVPEQFYDLKFYKAPLDRELSAKELVTMSMNDIEEKTFGLYPKESEKSGDDVELRAKDF
jgi:hypothetical protein